MAFRLPKNTQRVAVIGRTGSGKTQFGAWLLSEAPFNHQPYVIVDYKGDDLLGGSDRVREIGLHEKLPTEKQTGLYIIRPHPHQEEEVENWLWKVWQHERVGLYFDEAYVLPKGSNAFQAILTQGRSKRIPAICLTQRPSWISRFVFSEADFYAIFHLNDERDKKTVQAFTPKDRLDVANRLPEYHCQWYDVAQDEVYKMLPVPSADAIIDRIDSRLGPKAKRF